VLYSKDKGASMKKKYKDRTKKKDFKGKKSLILSLTTSKENLLFSYGLKNEKVSPEQPDDLNEVQQT
jgi:hypothetical protein